MGSTIIAERTPSVYYVERAGQWAAKIGYKRHPKTGERIRDHHWLGKLEGAAKYAAEKLAAEWDRQSREAKARGIKKPVWAHCPEPLDILAAAGNVIESPPTRDEGDDNGPTAAELHDTPDPEVEALAAATVAKITGRPAVSIEGTKDLWLAAQRARIGLAGKRGLKQSTYNQYVIEIGLAVNGAKGKGSPLDMSRQLHDLSRADLGTYVDYWAKLAGNGEISDCTAANYSKRFKQLLDWAAEQENLNFTMPKGADGLFAFGRFEGEIEEYTPATRERLKKLFAHATPRTRLYMLLAINTGFYQVDIGGFRRDEVVLDGEFPCIDRRRKREKSTNHETAPRRGIWWLFPETRELLAAQLAPEGSELALLNENGGPLYTVAADKAKTDAVTLAYGRLQDSAGVDFQFKQFRKLTSTAIVRYTLSHDLGRVFLGQATKGSLKVYNVNDFTPINEALQKWRDELKRHGVI